MKTFIYTKTEKHSNFYMNVTLTVYRVKKNQPIGIGETTFNSGSTYGDDSEVLRFLYSNKLVTKKQFELSKNGSCSAGYYSYDLHPKNGLKIVGV